VDLRDRFAVHFAAALVDAFPEADEIARRAYDLAEAMLAERARRIDRDEESALVEEGNAAIALLDEAMPWMEDEEIDLEPPYDPSWDLDERRFAASPSRPPGPGLARTQPPAEGEERKERSA
jgi:hypothetical protein